MYTIKGIKKQIDNTLVSSIKKNTLVSLSTSS